MKKISIIFFSVLMAIACNKKLTKEQVQAHLTETMSTFLNNEPKTRGIIDFNIQSVAYFEESDFYLCEFKVRMMGRVIDQTTHKKVDTIGTMKANIDKNFINVSRIY